MTNMTEAQDTEVSLRVFAERNDIYIGAAAWTQHLDVPEHREILAREFNMFTPEHEAKFCMISSARGEYDFSRFDQLVEFAEENDMVIHGHTLIWHACSPDWVENGDFSRDEAIEILKEHITTVVTRYKGRIKYWDVVNEVFDGAALRDTAWLRFIGPEYIEMAYQFAHEADPDALLLYNDYGAEDMNGKSDAIYEMAQDFLNRGIPIHGIGLQSHFNVDSINFTSVAENIARIGELGLEVQFTEVDIKYLGETDDEILRRQARDYYRLLEVCLDAENCTAFIVWGVSDRFSWLRDPAYFDNPTVQPLLFSEDYQPKPAYFALMDLLMRRVGATSVLSDDAIAAILNDPVEEVALPDATFADPNQLAPDSVPGVAYYAPMGVTITLDGDLSDWENIPRVTVDKGTLDGPGAESYEFAVAVDDTNLYFMANVTDSNVQYGEYGVEDWYQTDSIEFYINATGNLAAAAYEPGIVQIGMLAENATQPDTPLVGGGSSDTIVVSIAAVESETGYIIEASVPLVSDIWTITPEHMGVIGFQTHLNGSSGSGRDTKFIWSAADSQDQSWTNPSLFGQLIFWDGSQ
ncbi:MAG: endo-1,4-beta-xylanase [Anaerolineae bacterium]|nr:endo-1,4-beta-xylanase [Anaerolineae bacterium]